MIKKFALLATVAALFVACGSGTQENMENQAHDAANAAQETLDKAKAEKLGMTPMILARMDGLLCTTEMEYNGLKIDVDVGIEIATKLEEELDALLPKLNMYIPKDLPPELEFKWGSRNHISALIFGGSVKYKKKVPKKDADGNVLCNSYDKQDWPMVDGEPVDPDEFFANKLVQDVYVSGKNKGAPKFRQVKVPREIRTVFKEFIYDFKGYTTPNPLWATKNTGARGKPEYSVDADTVEELGYLTQDFRNSKTSEVSETSEV